MNTPSLDGRLSAMGTVADRSEEALEIMKSLGIREARFTHNEIELTIFSDSNTREMGWQYEAKHSHRLRAKMDYVHCD